MPKIQYQNIRFGDGAIEIIKSVEDVIARYHAQGYALTLRQVYYQFVAKDLFPDSRRWTWNGSKWKQDPNGTKNADPNYKWLGTIIADGRLAGLIDWNSIEDRTREIDGNSHWDTPADIISSAAGSFKIDKWADQNHRIEIWVEKDALEGVVGKAAKAMDVQFFSCRGYASATSIWDAGQRLRLYAEHGQTPVILHLGDHDPSGIDMSRDIEERLKLFMDGEGDSLLFERIALNMDQVKEYAPPPNPAKVTDSRYQAYADLHGEESWELDALEPAVIETLIRDRIGHYRDAEKFEAAEEIEQRHVRNLARAAKHWDSRVAPFVERIKTK